MAGLVVEGRRLYVPGTDTLWPWWVGPDPAGRWHVALAPEKPQPESRTWAEAVCGLKPPTPWIDPRRGRWQSWKYQQVRPAPGGACCPTCLMDAQRHDWPRPAGVVALMQPSTARTARRGGR